jgi:VCBS repeat-containing protein
MTDQTTTSGTINETSFLNTPQAVDDFYGSEATGLTEDNSGIYYFNVMLNDLGGKAKILWSTDDGVNDSGALDGHEAGDLLAGDSIGSVEATSDTSLNGAPIWITADGKIGYDTTAFDPAFTAELQALTDGEVLTDSFTYAIRLSNGTASWATVTIEFTGTNDGPTLSAAALSATEDGPAVQVDLSTLGDDVDSDDDGGSLTYAVVSGPSEGTATITGTTLSFDPGADFQDLAVGETRDVLITVSATDSHGAVVQNTVTVTVTGTNDGPTLSAAALAATEDGPSVQVDLSTLGDDIDSDDDGASLVYAVVSGPSGGTATITGTTLSFDPGADFQDLAAGETREVVITVSATDSHGAVVQSDIIVTVTGESDASPTFDLLTLDGTNGFNITGFSVSVQSTVSDAGDINGDGIDDLIIGTPRDNTAYVIFGSASGFDASLDVSTLDGSNGFVVVGTGQTGFSVSGAGDINGDGIDDFVIGAPFEDSNGQRAAGATYVVFGSSTGFNPLLDLSTLDGTNGFAINGIYGSTNGNSDRSGWSVSSAGDVNGDGIDDLIIGSPFVGSSYDLSIGGETYIVFGSTSGFDASLDLSTLDGTNGFAIRGIPSVLGLGTDRSGWSVSSAGDINADGIDDLIIGAPGGDQGAVNEVGEAYVVFGSATGFDASFDLSTLDGTNGFTITGDPNAGLTGVGFNFGQAFGTSVSDAGDINGDGIDDLIIGAPNANNYVGSSYIVFGSSAPFAATLDVASLDGSNGFVINGFDQRDFSGLSVSGAGDINGDGIDDLIVGSYGADPNGLYYAGSSYVVFGSTAGFDASFDLESLDGTNGFAIHGVEEYDVTGLSVSGAGDVNGDGIDDLAVSSYNGGQIGNGFSYDGSVYIIFGRNTFDAQVTIESALNSADDFLFS